MTALSRLFRWALAWSQERCAHHWVHRTYAWCDCGNGQVLHALMRCRHCGVVACVLEEVD